MLNTVCIDGLPVWVTASQLRSLCEQWGDVVGVRVVQDGYATSIGYAFVEMATRQEAERLLVNLNQHQVFERLLFVARTYPACDRDFSSTRPAPSRSL